jgi:hypothetical protein
MLYDHYLEMRLDEWARWNVDILLGNLGYPKISPIAIIVEMGVLIRSGQPKSPIEHPKAEEVNSWVKRMELDYPRYAQALRDYYYNRGNFPLRAIAHYRKISISTLKARVESAKIWLSGHLSANEQEKESRYG